MVYGGAALVDVNWPNGLSDGTVFGNLGGVTRISVSADGQNFYLLNPSLAPVTEAALPTDSAGQFGLPPNPALTPAAFAGKTLPEIRALYGGSAGGVGYDLGWAIDAQGQPVSLQEIHYVRLSVLEGQIKLDALAAVPEPATWLLGLAGVGLLAWVRRQRNSARP
ncbi:MAG: PEP-CTERM sorting domain-containing protein [Verrucomicrobiae bacterium]|nr:PEP-CTERM sorting domain-containing protein [Verrucomicrobiae bacterium]